MYKDAVKNVATNALKHLIGQLEDKQQISFTK